MTTKRQLEVDLCTDLTEQQERVMDYIEKCIEDGLPPTRAEIAKALGFKSPNAAQLHVDALVRKGRITVVPAVARGIKLVQP